MGAPLGALGKLLGIELPDVQKPPKLVPLTDAQLRQITTPPAIPASLFNVRDLGLQEGAIVETSQAIVGATRQMRAALLRLQDRFYEINGPQSYAIWLLDQQMDAMVLDAERKLLQRWQRYPRWETIPPRWPVDLTYFQEVALARNHVHTATMLGHMMATLPVLTPERQEATRGLFIRLTPQELEISRLAQKARYGWPKYTQADVTRSRQTGRELWKPVYPTNDPAPRPLTERDYELLPRYAQHVYQQHVKAREPMEKTQAWFDLWEAMRARFADLPALGAAARAAGEQQRQAWLKQYDDMQREWIARHPEMRGELEHAATLVMPDARWAGWKSGPPWSVQGADGTRLDYVSHDAQGNVVTLGQRYAQLAG